MKRMLIALTVFMVVFSSQAFSTRCGDLYTSGLRIDTRSCSEILKGQGKLWKKGLCADLLNEVERINSYMEANKITCTGEALRQFKNDLRNAVIVLNRAKNRGWQE